MKALLLAVLVPSWVLASGAGSSSGALGFSLWGGAFMPGMYDVRRAVDADNEARLASDWDGGSDASGLERGLAGGLEISYGVLADVRVVVAGETRGVSWSGRYLGTGPNTAVDPLLGLQRQEYDARITLSSWGVEGGASFVLRRFEHGSNVSLALRGGMHRLYGQGFRNEETGPLAEWSQWGSFEATAAGGMAGMEWEWLYHFDGSSAAFGVRLEAGYRFLVFPRLKYTWRDDSGGKDSGDWEDSGGDPIPVDFSGPEIRFGLKFAFKPGA